VIALIDYGAGNLASVKKALAAVGAEVHVPQQPADLAEAAGIVVPGVGHFGATARLQGAWTDAILERVGEGRPLLGICLGMQWLYEASDEAPDVPGLGLLSGRCFRLPGAGVKVPHVGWNTLQVERPAPIVDAIASDSQVYFTHSYAAPSTNDTAATTVHGSAFAAAVQRGYIAGVQFHPEKSGDVGLQVLRNFLAMVG
jgi:imidazole glycerol-phosphate synthase subunit HisH